MHPKLLKFFVQYFIELYKTPILLLTHSLRVLLAWSPLLWSDLQYPIPSQKQRWRYIFWNLGYLFSKWKSGTPTWASINVFRVGNILIPKPFTDSMRTISLVTAYTSFGRICSNVWFDKITWNSELGRGTCYCKFLLYFAYLFSRSYKFRHMCLHQESWVLDHYITLWIFLHHIHNQVIYLFVFLIFSYKNSPKGLIPFEDMIFPLMFSIMLF